MTLQRWIAGQSNLTSFVCRLKCVFCNVLPITGTGIKSCRGRWSFGKGRATGCTTVSFSNALNRGRPTYPAMPAKTVGCSTGFLRKAPRVDHHQKTTLIAVYIFFNTETFRLHFFQYYNQFSTNLTFAHVPFQFHDTVFNRE